MSFIITQESDRVFVIWYRQTEIYDSPVGKFTEKKIALAICDWLNSNYKEKAKPHFESEPESKLEGKLPTRVSNPNFDF